jgi:hypothetical protein
MRTLCCVLMLLFGLVAVACGGGSSSGKVINDGDDGSTALAGSFVADQASPGASSVAAAEGDGSSGNLVIVEVNVTGTDDLFGAAFDVVYDPGRASFVNWAPGDAFEDGGETVAYQVSASQAGRVVVGIGRTGAGAGGVNVSGTVPVIRLTFRVDQAGSSTVGFENASLQDAQSPPQDIQGISWFGGTLVAN